MHIWIKVCALLKFDGFFGSAFLKNKKSPRLACKAQTFVQLKLLSLNSEIKSNVFNSKIPFYLVLKVRLDID